MHRQTPAPGDAAGDGRSDALKHDRFGLSADALQRQQIERNTRYAYWFTSGRCTPGAWAAVAVMLIGIGFTALCAIVMGAHELLKHTLILAAPALLIAVIAGQLVNGLIKHRLERVPRELADYQHACILRRLRSDPAEGTESTETTGDGPESRET